MVKANKQFLLGAVAGLCNCIIERLDLRTSSECVCVCETLSQAGFWLRPTLVEKCWASSTQLFSTVSCYTWLFFFVFFFLAAGAPRGEIWKGKQQEYVRWRRMKVSKKCKMKWNTGVKKQNKKNIIKEFFLNRKRRQHETDGGRESIAKQVSK